MFITIKNIILWKIKLIKLFWSFFDINTLIQEKELGNLYCRKEKLRKHKKLEVQKEKHNNLRYDLSVRIVK